MTALAGFLIACAVTLLLLWGGWIAVVGATALCGWLLVRSHLRRPAPAAPEQAEASTIRALQPGESADEVLCLCTGEVCAVMEQVTRTYNRTLVAVFKENRRVRARWSAPPNGFSGRPATANIRSCRCCAASRRATSTRGISMCR